jgi:cell division protein FtsL
VGGGEAESSMKWFGQGSHPCPNKGGGTIPTLTWHDLNKVGEKDSRQDEMKTTRFVPQKTKSLKLKLVLIFLLPILLSSLYIWQRVTVITLSTQIKELKVKIKQQQKTLNYMQIEVTKLSSIDRIEKTAQGMGFVRPPIDSIGLIQESADSTYIREHDLRENVWAKLKTLKKNLFSSDKAEAKEIKHDQ